MHSKFKILQPLQLLIIVLLRVKSITLTRHYRRLRPCGRQQCRDWWVRRCAWQPGGRAARPLAGMTRHSAQRTPRTTRAVHDRDAKLLSDALYQSL